MIYGVGYTRNGVDFYKKVDDDGKTREFCVAKHPPFQDWLRKNKDNLPSDIKSKVDNNTLTIEKAE
tara:strand:- start:121 stop:318 length:198 start_codon:yes stop_codon:yes gene_type:complete